MIEVSDEVVLSDVRFENLRIWGNGQANLATVRPYITQYAKAKTWGKIERVVFKDLAVSGPPGKYTVLLDAAPHHGNLRIREVSGENVRVLGEPVTDDSLRLVLGPWIARPAGSLILFRR